VSENRCVNCGGTEGDIERVLGISSHVEVSACIFEGRKQRERAERAEGALLAISDAAQWIELADTGATGYFIDGEDWLNSGIEFLAATTHSPQEGQEHD
jgi:hypothetical protein